MNRFEVDVKGMRELQGSRELWRLVKELPVNVFDEFAREDVAVRPTKCTVTVEPVEGKRRIKVVCEDDGQGFQALEDAYTLFRSTPKRGQPQVAGRFNLGEKEIMAVAYSGSIETTAGTVEFPEDGGRRVNRWRKYPFGTRVTLELPAKKEELEACIRMLRRLIPPIGLRLQVNDEEVYRAMRPEFLTRAHAGLSTIIQKAPGQPLQHSWRQTEVVIYSTPEGEQSWLYELGCPIQPIECSYTVDIRQKVPMPPERDTVSASYLQDVFAVVANAMAQKLDEQQVAETWVKQALEDTSTDVEAVKEIIHKRHGEKVVLWSTNVQALEDALEAGYSIVGKTALSPEERKAYERAGVQRASAVFGRKPEVADAVEPTEDMQRVAQFAQALAEALLGFDDLHVVFYRQHNNPAMADYTASTRELGFNVAQLSAEWFERITSEQTATILHELAHHGADNGQLPHGPQYVNRVSWLGAKLFHLMLGFDERLARHLKSWHDEWGKDKEE